MGCAASATPAHGEKYGECPQQRHRNRHREEVVAPAVGRAGEDEHGGGGGSASSSSSSRRSTEEGDSGRPRRPRAVSYVETSPINEEEAAEHEAALQACGSGHESDGDECEERPLASRIGRALRVAKIKLLAPDCVPGDVPPSEAVRANLSRVSLLGICDFIDDHVQEALREEVLGLWRSREAAAGRRPQEAMSSISGAGDGGGGEGTISSSGGGRGAGLPFFVARSCAAPPAAAPAPARMRGDAEATLPAAAAQQQQQQQQQPPPGSTPPTSSSSSSSFLASRTSPSFCSERGGQEGAAQNHQRHHQQTPQQKGVQQQQQQHQPRGQRRQRLSSHFYLPSMRLGTATVDVSSIVDVLIQHANQILFAQQPHLPHPLSATDAHSDVGGCALGMLSISSAPDDHSGPIGQTFFATTTTINVPQVAPEETHSKRADKRDCDQHVAEKASSSDSHRCPPAAVTDFEEFVARPLGCFTFGSPKLKQLRQILDDADVPGSVGSCEGGGTHHWGSGSFSPGSFSPGSACNSFPGSQGGGSGGGNNNGAVHYSASASMSVLRSPPCSPQVGCGIDDGGGGDWPTAPSPRVSAPENHRTLGLTRPIIPERVRPSVCEPLPSDEAAVPGAATRAQVAHEEDNSDNRDAASDETNRGSVMWEAATGQMADACAPLCDFHHGASPAPSGTASTASSFYLQSIPPAALGHGIPPFLLKHRASPAAAAAATTTAITTTTGPTTGEAAAGMSTLARAEYLLAETPLLSAENLLRYETMCKRALIAAANSRDNPRLQSSFSSGGPVAAAVDRGGSGACRSPSFAEMRSAQADSGAKFPPVSTLPRTPHAREFFRSFGGNDNSGSSNNNHLNDTDNSVHSYGSISSKFFEANDSSSTATTPPSPLAQHRLTLDWIFYGDSRVVESERVMQAALARIGHYHRSVTMGTSASTTWILSQRPSAA